MYDGESNSPQPGSEKPRWRHPAVLSQQPDFVVFLFSDNPGLYHGGLNSLPWGNLVMQTRLAALLTEAGECGWNDIGPTWEIWLFAENIHPTPHPSPSQLPLSSTGSLQSLEILLETD